MEILSWNQKLQARDDHSCYFIQEVEAHLLHFGLISSVWGLTLLCVVFTAEVLRACRSDRWSAGKAARRAYMTST